MRLFPFYLFVASWVLQEVLSGHPLEEGRIPKRFEDDDLPGRLPANSTKEYPYLGRILKLSNFFQPKLVATKFSIYTRRNQIEDITFNPNHYCYPDTCHGPFQYDLAALAESGFDPKLRTIIMTPGYLTDDRPGWIRRAKDLWLQLEDVNIIMTTWKDGNRFMYSAAVSNTPVVARQISILLYYLSKLHGVELEDQSFLDRIQLVGHSLGAHISGFVGKDFGGRLSRITGLDPAGPEFDDTSRARRLDKSDAKLVTAFHSNRGKLDYVKAVRGGVDEILNIFPKFAKGHNRKESTGKKEANQKKKVELPSNQEELPSVMRDGISLLNSLNQVIDGSVVSYNNPWFGIDEQVADIDYYANDGAEQPGCKDFMHICDHGRSTELYEDILRFELARRTQSRSKEWLKANRLLAFTSDDFDDFLVGHNLNEQCPVVIRQAFSGEVEKSFPDCSIPIDLVSPVEELIEELKSEYHLELDDKRKGFTTRTRYWFKTLDKPPFMGDHYLLKVKVEPEMSFWDESCSLKAEMNMAGLGQRQIVETETNKGIELVSEENFHGLAIPFVNPLGPEAKVALNNILAKNLIARKGEMPDISREVSKILPVDVKLSIVTSNLDYLVGSDKKENAEKCSLKIAGVEVLPIIGNQRNLAADYFQPNAAKRNGISTAKKGWFGGKQSKRKMYILDPDVLSVNGNTSLTKKFQKLLIKRPKI